MATPLERLVLVCNERLSEEASDDTETLDDPTYRCYEAPRPLSHHKIRKRPPVVHLADDGWACESCHTDETPQRRRGPRGAKSMCNACGLRWIKRRRREGEEPPAVPRGSPLVKKCATFGTCYETVLGEDYERLKHKRHPFLKDSYVLSMGWSIY